jgi:hypothetical protein
MNSSASTSDSAASPSVDSIESPCVDVCKLDSNFVCIGCRRTIDEVLKWPEYTDEQKKAVLDRLFGDN